MSGKNKKQKLTTLGYIIWSIGGAVLLLFVIAFIVVSVVPRPRLLAQRVDGKVRVDSEIRLTFDLPVSRQMNVELTPKTFGEIQYDHTLIGQHLVRTFVFRPEVTWLPDTTYEVRVSNIKSALPTYRAPREFVFTFTTEAVPSVTTVSPEKDSTVRSDTVWRVGLDRANNKLVEYEFRFSPSLAVEARLSEDKTTYILTPTRQLSQGGHYALEILQKNVRYLFGSNELARQEEGETVWQGSWLVREAPGISGFSPEGGAVPLDTAIGVVFSENVDFDSFREHVTIEPAVDGEWQTTDYKTVTFKPTALTQETTYTVTLLAGLKTYDGGFLTEDSIHTFTTVGPVKIASASPAPNSQGVGVNSSIRLTFDQLVDEASARNKFSINPSGEGDFSWDKTTMVYKPRQALSYNTTYTITVDSGVKSQYGFDSETAQTITFTTELSVTSLAVPFHRQEHNLSCEVATLVMVLAYRGINVPEATLIEMIGFDPTEKNKGVWGNPHLAFVGDIDGHQPSTGYGVYWQPIAAAAQKYRPARWFTGGTITDLTAEIKKGNPVIVWGTAGSGRRIDWQTPQGDKVVAVSGEHTRVVIGYIGSAENPSKIITLDPLSGEKYFSKENFLWNWGLLNNSGVVVE